MQAGALEQNNMIKVLTFSKSRLEVSVKLPFAFLSGNLFLTKGKQNLCQIWPDVVATIKGIVLKGWYICRVSLRWETFRCSHIYSGVVPLLCYKREEMLNMFKYWYMTTAKTELLIMHLSGRQLYSYRMPNEYSQAINRNCLCCTSNSLQCLYYNNKNKKGKMYIDE